MQIKYNQKRDILLIDFADNISELEKDNYKAKFITILPFGDSRKIRGFVIADASNRLPKGFRDQIEQL